MSDNNFDISILKKESGYYQVSVTYWHFGRARENEIRRMTSSTTYRWSTSYVELINWFQTRKTKVFYSQLRVLCKYYGKKETQKF